MSLTSTPPIKTDSFRSQKQTQLKTYKRRYLVCFTFAFNSIANAMMWITFAPIQTTASEYFHVSQAAINIFSMSFMITYVPGSILCAWMFKKYYLRKSFIFSSFAQLIGSVLRYVATLHFVTSNSWNKYVSYGLVLFGQSMAAFCQPFYTNSPARIPAEWFSKEGRDVATALLSIINPLGIGFGSFIPTLFVSAEGNHWNGFSGIMLLELIICSIGFILTLLFFYDKPPTSPSISQFKKQTSAIKRSLNYDFQQIIRNKQFFFLFCGFGIGLGLFNALTTLINQYTASFGYSTDNAGNFGGLLIGGGLLGAVIAGVSMEIYRQYRSILKIFTGSTCIVMLFLLWQLQPDNLIIVSVLFGIFGFVAVPIIAVTFEAAAECTYPINEELSSALLMTSGSIFGIAFILIWGSQLPNEGEQYHDQWNFSTYFLVSNGFIMFIFMLLFSGEYKRLMAENQFSKYIEDLNEEDISILESETFNEKQIQNNNRRQQQIFARSESHKNSISDNSYQNMKNNMNNNKNNNKNKTAIIKNGNNTSTYIVPTGDTSIDKEIKYNDV